MGVQAGRVLLCVFGKRQTCASLSAPAACEAPFAVTVCGQSRSESRAALGVPVSAARV